MAERAFGVKNGRDDGGGGTDSPDGVASRRIVGESASVIFPCSIEYRRWRAIMEEVDNVCNKFCVTLCTVTRWAIFKTS